MKMKVEIKDKALNQQLNNALQRNKNMTAKIMTAVLLDLSKQSTRRAPIESGDLRRDCSADVGTRNLYKNMRETGNKVLPAERIVGSVGYSLDYAVRQHEDLTLRHDRTDGYIRPDGTSYNMVAGGEAKYLERPFNENMNKYIDMFKKIPSEVLK